MTTGFNPKFETVMIIDDNTIDLYVCSRMITKNNFGKEVLKYSVSTEALKYLQDNQDNFSVLPASISANITINAYNSIPKPGTRFKPLPLNRSTPSPFSRKILCIARALMRSGIHQYQKNNNNSLVIPKKNLFQSGGWLKSKC